MELRIVTHDVLPSSNNVVKHAIEAGEPEGLVVRTLKQTAGYGRLGRSWVSPEGGMYFSLLLRPQVSLMALPTLGLVVALALHRALEGVFDEGRRADLKVKWPNDLVWKGGDRERGVFPKISGMSLERHAGGTCVGIGVNVLRPADQQSVGGKNYPVYLAELLQDRMDAAGVATKVDPQGLTDQQRALVLHVSELFLESFAPLYDQWQEQGFAPLMAEYAEKLCLTGERVMVINQFEEQMVAGVVEGVDESGRLLLRTDSGALEAVSSGEVRFD